MFLRKIDSSGAALRRSAVTIALLVVLACSCAGCGLGAPSSAISSEHALFDPAYEVWLTGYPAPFLVTSAGGGRMWNGARLAQRSLVFVGDVHFVNAQAGWAVGDGGVVFWTRDGGSTWVSHQFAGNYNFIKVCAYGPFRAWAIASDGRVVRTTDGGNRWRIGRMPGQNLVMQDITFVDAEHGWAVGSELSEGIVMATHDGGRNWAVQRVIKGPQGESIQAVVFSDPRHGWCVGTTTSGAPDVVGRSLILRTVDGGIHWTTQATVQGTSLTSIACQGSLTACAVGTRGSTLRTTDGGLSWRRSTAPELGTLTDVVFATASDGWCLGGAHDRPLLLTTRDGGASWTSVPLTGPASELRGLLGLSAIRSRSH